jgi:putative ABC transport system substrate-binding protein
MIQKQLPRDSIQKRAPGLGWGVGKNLHIDYGWAGRDAERFPYLAAEMVGLSPDVIVANGSDAMRALQQSTRTLPIVFLAVVDPVGAGYVANLGRPGGNATGLTLFEYSIAGKWLELLKQIAPRVTRAAVLRDARLASGIGQFAPIQTAAQSFGLEVDPIDVRDPAGVESEASEIERTLAVFACGSDLGLLVTTSALAATHRDLIVALATRYSLPAGLWQLNSGQLGGWTRELCPLFFHS